MCGAGEACLLRDVMTNIDRGGCRIMSDVLTLVH